MVGDEAGDWSADAAERLRSGAVVQCGGDGRELKRPPVAVLGVNGGCTVIGARHSDGDRVMSCLQCLQFLGCEL